MPGRKMSKYMAKGGKYMSKMAKGPGKLKQMAKGGRARLKGGGISSRGLGKAFMKGGKV